MKYTLCLVLLLFGCSEAKKEAVYSVKSVQNDLVPKSPKTPVSYHALAFDAVRGTKYFVESTAQITNPIKYTVESEKLALGDKIIELNLYEDTRDNFHRLDMYKVIINKEKKTVYRSGYDQDFEEKWILIK